MLSPGSSPHVDGETCESSSSEEPKALQVPVGEFVNITRQNRLTPSIPAYSYEVTVDPYQGEAPVTGEGEREDVPSSYEGADGACLDVEGAGRHS